MRAERGWSRREFVATLGLAGAATAMPAAPALAMDAGEAGLTPRPKAGPSVLYLTMPGIDQGAWRGIVPTYADGGRWTSLTPGGEFTRWFPGAMAVHPSLDTLYVAHSEWAPEGRERGGVSGYAIDRVTWQLEERGAEPLALSSTDPESLAVSPDGRWLLVAASGGGAYNVLPIGEDGRLRVVEHVLKMTGGGPWRRSAFPTKVLFHPAGLLYGSDMAADRIDVISLEGLRTGDAPVVVGRKLFASGSGPAEMALSPRNDALFTVTRWRPAIVRVPVDPQRGVLAGDAQRLQLDGRSGGPVAASPAGDRVYVATQETRVGTHTAMPTRAATLISVVDVSKPRLGLRLIERVRVPEITYAQRLLVHGDELLLLGQGGVCAIPLDDGRGRLGERTHVLTKGHYSDAVVRTL